MIYFDTLMWFNMWVRRKQMRRLVILVTVLTIGLFLVSCGGSTPATTTTPAASSTPAVTPATPASPSVDAAKLYSDNCAVCHGATRQGIPNLAPALTQASLADDSVAEITGIITDGVANTAMAGFKTRLSSAQIDALANFVKTVNP